MLCILRCFDIRSDMCHGEAVICFTCTAWTFHEILIDLIDANLPPAVDAHVFPWTYFLAYFYFLWFCH